jgi:hypothetical protein
MDETRVGGFRILMPPLDEPNPIALANELL